MDTYTVEFRIQGATLDPKEVTKILGLEPSMILDVTTIANSKRNNRKPLWSYDGLSTETEFVEKEWESLEKGLLFLLDRLLPKRKLIQEKFHDHDKFLWCGHFQDSFDGGPSFSPKLLRMLAEFGVELIISNYRSNEDE